MCDTVVENKNIYQFYVNVHLKMRNQNAVSSQKYMALILPKLRIYLYISNYVQLYLEKWSIS